ncbi:MAG: hypothetical protein PHN69_02715 [Candidatus Pacebacteria bacterium]|nr:hypothetical protein [Candidatus Paceibacterota bacterium]
MDLKEKIVGITFGIRFNRSFRVPEISGEMIDDILYGNKTPFGTEFFPKVQETAREKTLFNNKTNEYLRINTDDIILGIEIKDDFEKKFEWLKTDVLNYFKDILFKNYGLKNIRRVGIVFSHKVEKDPNLDSAIKVLTKDKIDAVDNVNISFSKKLPATDALIRKDVNDYKNTIYNITEMDSAILAELDYQYYYNPPIEDLRECFVDKILADAKTFLEGSYYNWLKLENKNAENK